MENVFGSFKADVVHQQRHPTSETTERDLFAHIEGYINRRRPHPALSGITTGQAELRIA